MTRGGDEREHQRLHDHRQRVVVRWSQASNTARGQRVHGSLGSHDVALASDPPLPVDATETPEITIFRSAAFHAQVRRRQELVGCIRGVIEFDELTPPMQEVEVIAIVGQHESQEGLVGLVRLELDCRWRRLHRAGFRRRRRSSTDRAGVRPLLFTVAPHLDP